jgi:hypothetical protein
LPFIFRDTGTEVGCKSATPADSTAFTTALSCLLTDEILAGDLKENPELQADVINRKRPPIWARKWLSEITPVMTVVSVMINGNGDAYSFVFLIVGDRVQGVFKDVSFERN